MNITHEKLLDTLRYDALTGQFYWRAKRGHGIPKSGLAGGSTANGYLSVRLDGEKFLLHRLAWLYVHGSLPDGHIDHVNGIGTDNRIENLRLCTHQQNAQNRTKVRSSTGFMGVRVQRGKYKASICANGVYFHLGTFETAAEASVAYQNKKRELHPFWGGFNNK